MLDPRWQTTNFIDLIAAAVAERNVAVLPILSDALMDAGCDDEELLGYLRQQDATWFDLLDCYQAYWLVKHEGRPLEPDDVLNWMWRFSKAGGTNETLCALKEWAGNMGIPLEWAGNMGIPLEWLGNMGSEFTPAQFVASAARYQCFDQTMYMAAKDSYREYEVRIAEFWKVYETLTGATVADRTDAFFSCAC